MDTLLKKAAKIPLGLPISTSSRAIEVMGTVSTIEERITAQKYNELRRLEQTEAGIQLLQSIGYDSQKKTVDEYSKLQPRETTTEDSIHSR